MTNPACNPSVVSVFNFKSNEVRTVIRDGEPWFVASDVAAALGYRNAPDAVRYLSSCQKADTLIQRTSSNGSEQTRSVTLINESGLYRLVLRSRKPEAAAFSDWVTGEVLPSIRKTGRYSAPSSQCASNNVQRLLQALNAPNGVYIDTPTLIAFIQAASARLANRCEFYENKNRGEYK